MVFQVVGQSKTHDIMMYNDIQLITYDGGETWIDVSPSIILNEIKYERK